MRNIKLDYGPHELDKAIEFMEDDKIVVTLCTSNIHGFPKTKRDWLSGKLSWNALMTICSNDVDAYEESAPDF